MDNPARGRLGRYELLAPLVSGGMGDVWLARAVGPSGFQRLFAIKTIRTERAADSEFRAMFLDEARIAAQIQSEYVVAVFELGEEQGSLYMVMEWVHGDSLRRIAEAITARGSLVPVHVALSIASDACRGLDVAHQLADGAGVSLDVVHRDISPHNLLVTDTGLTKVIDFGIAKAKDRYSQKSSVGSLKGKLRYMAPEQAVGALVDRRADVWALGAVLFELLAGRPPFDGDSDAIVLGQLMTSDVPELPETVPLPLRRVVKRALAREPGDRYATCEGMRRALEDAADELDISFGHEEVAAFLKVHVPDLVRQRSEMIKQTVGLGDATADTTTLVTPRTDEKKPLEETLRLPAHAPSPSGANSGTLASASVDTPPRAPRSQPLRSAALLAMGALIAAAIYGSARYFGPAENSPKTLTHVADTANDLPALRNEELPVPKPEQETSRETSQDPGVASAAASALAAPAESTGKRRPPPVKAIKPRTFVPATRY